jgi:hypothetical protein
VTTGSDDLGERFRQATTDLRSEPVRWDRVARLARRRAVLTLLGFLLLSCVPIIVISGGLLAGKAAVDPAFHPPLVARHARLSVRFEERHAERGHVVLRDFLAQTRQSGVGLSVSKLGARGFVFAVRVELKGYRNAPVNVRWTVFDVASRQRVATAVHATTASVRPRSQSETIPVSVWVPYIKPRGTFFVRFRLIDTSGRVISQRDSAPFVALRRDFFTSYRTPTYTADIPAKWTISENYGAEKERRFVTLVHGPHNELLDIDTTPNWSGDFEHHTRALEADVARASKAHGIFYRRIRLQRESLRGKAFEWTFRLGRWQKTDIFFKRGRDGFAILTRGTPAQYSELRTVARDVAYSIRPR